MVSDLECVIRVELLSVSTPGNPFVPLWEYFLFQELTDVMMRSYACLMGTSDLAL